MKKTLLLLPVAMILFACGGNATETSSSNASDDTAHINQQAKTDVEVAKDVDADTFRQLMTERPDAIIIDVRTPEEVNAGMIEGAEHIDFYNSDFADQLNQLDPEKPVLVYCAAGGRSGKAMEIMHEKGFKEVYNLAGGFRGWSAGGFPVVIPEQ